MCQSIINILLSQHYTLANIHMTHAGTVLEDNTAAQVVTCEVAIRPFNDWK